MRELKRGRERFKRLLQLLDKIQPAVGLLPRGICSILWVRSRSSGSMAARARRQLLIRRLAAGCGDLVDIREQVFLLGLQNLTVGSRVSIHPLCYIDASGGLRIGNDVSIAHGVTIMTTEHQFDSTTVSIRDQGVARRPVEVQDDVWIGAGARILAGVKIGRGAIVAASAVVTHSVEPFSIVAGVPARVIGTRA